MNIFKYNFINSIILSNVCDPSSSKTSNFILDLKNTSLKRLGSYASYYEYL